MPWHDLQYTDNMPRKVSKDKEVLARAKKYIGAVVRVPVLNSKDKKKLVNAEVTEVCLEGTNMDDAWFTVERQDDTAEKSWDAWEITLDEVKQGVMTHNVFHMEKQKAGAEAHTSISAGEGVTGTGTFCICVGIVVSTIDVTRRTVVDAHV